MDTESSILLRNLLDHETVAALATLHGGEPAISMVPFVLRDDGSFLAHVSALATHTRDMREHARVSLLVVAPPAADVPPQARPRVSFDAEACFLAPGSDAARAGRDAYLARFPDAAITFELADFSLVALVPRAARLIGGFGRAHGLVGEALRRWLARSDAP